MFLRVRKLAHVGAALVIAGIAVHSTIARTLPGAPSMLLWRDGKLVPAPFSSLAFQLEPDCVARETRRFSAVRALLPHTGMVGYVGLVHGEACHFAVQEVLAPLLVIDLEQRPTVGTLPPFGLHVPPRPPLTVVDTRTPGGATWLREHEHWRVLSGASSGIYLVAGGE